MQYIKLLTDAINWSLFHHSSVKRCEFGWASPGGHDYTSCLRSILLLLASNLDSSLAWTNDSNQVDTKTCRKCQNSLFHPFGNFMELRSFEFPRLKNADDRRLLFLWTQACSYFNASLHKLTECNRERKCADTIGTVLVSWAGYFQC